MFVSRLTWIAVFLAFSSFHSGFPMVKGMPVSSTSAPIDTRLKGSTPARTTTTRRFISKPSAQNSSDSSLVKDVDEEFDNVIDIEEEVLRPVITRKYALHSPCSGHSIRMMGTKSNIIKADADSHSSYAQLTVRSVRPEEISISNDISQRFLCFNRHGKLIMRLEFKDRFCTYHERTQDNYVVLQSSYNQNWFVGFGRDGNSLKGADWKLKLVKNQGCYKFLKTGVKIYESMSDISHNHIPKHHPKKIQKFLDSTLESLPVLKYSTILPGTRLKRTPVPIPETIPKVSRPVLGNSGQYDEAVAV